MSQKQEKATFFNSSAIKKSILKKFNKGFATISHDHKHINAANVSMVLYPDSSPKKSLNLYSTMKKK
jgi:hypothetical protein